MKYQKMTPNDKDCKDFEPSGMPPDWTRCVRTLSCKIGVEGALGAYGRWCDGMEKSGPLPFHHPKRIEISYAADNYGGESR